MEASGRNTIEESSEAAHGAQLIAQLVLSASVTVRSRSSRLMHPNAARKTGRADAWYSKLFPSMQHWHTNQVPRIHQMLLTHALINSLLFELLESCKQLAPRSQTGIFSWQVHWKVVPCLLASPPDKLNYRSMFSTKLLPIARWPAQQHNGSVWQSCC